MLYLIDNATGNAHEVGADYAIRTLLAAGYPGTTARAMVIDLLNSEASDIGAYQFLLRDRTVILATGEYGPMLAGALAAA